MAPKVKVKTEDMMDDATANQGNPSKPPQLQSRQSIATLITLSWFLLAVFVMQMPNHHHEVTSTSAAKESRVDAHDKSHHLPMLAVSPFLVTTSSSTALESKEVLVNALLKPMLLQVAAVLVLQSVGVPLLSNLGIILRRIPLVHVLRLPLISQLARSSLAKGVSKAGSVVWKNLYDFYYRTNASKLTNRAKKIVKFYLHLNDDHDADHHHAEHAH